MIRYIYSGCLVCMYGKKNPMTSEIAVGVFPAASSDYNATGTE